VKPEGLTDGLRESDLPLTLQLVRCLWELNGPNLDAPAGSKPLNPPPGRGPFKSDSLASENWIFHIYPVSS